MNEPELDIPEEFYAYKSRAASYIARLSGFPFQWALPDSSTTQTGFPTSFFRWDQRRFRRLIEHAEHLIRCLIIWMAYARLRSGLVRDGLSSVRDGSPERAPSRPPDDRFEESKNSPERVLCENRSREQSKEVHPHFVLRGLPLYDQKLPAFRVSLPESPSPGLGEGFGMRAEKEAPHLTPRLRNDTIYTCDRLIARMERLGTLIEEIDARAGRIAGIWLARMSSRAQCETLLCSANTGPDVHTLPVSGPGSARHHSMLHRIRDDTCWHPIPIKSPDPPPDILQDASDEERDDLLALHDAAIRAAELFSQHCG
ncbi:hypothetical protein [Ponticaulis sp.]|uniref:hypothetical protein n=1 Tax=Ponticaulis sp. TaxID=2020902 RepID=UPI000B724DE1|nr:hypothetical protein [Ponticaulis sp.]MAJ08842.1 hypothetical protein [Ponticaulis sp.]RPG17535.1 MAG: hypothetical protein CBC85_006135 [Hyphomonadaceae bacterium TMED125]HBJ93549.1 hypothetical protein [Hyphomonadaceae bacterium]|tara:strand:+ start:3810 stop:4748 length:939 start_codon:yes stop_codon:yes gene_type:complete